MAEYKIAKVVFDIGVDKEFDYIIPAGLSLRKGARVLLDFNRRKMVGVVVSLAAHSNIPNLKPVIDVLDDTPFLNSESISFAKRLRKEYPYSLGEMVFMMLHPSLRRKKRTSISHQVSSSKDGPKRFKKTLIKADNFGERFNMYKDKIKATLTRGSVMIFFPTVDYLNSASRVIDEYFSSAVRIHSRQNPKDNFKNWVKARGAKSLIVGTRGTIFHYPSDLSLIIVEDDSSPYYFNPEKPYYNLVKVAEILCRHKYIELIISSDYPALSTYKDYKNKKIGLYENAAKTNDVKVFDFNRLRTKKARIFTPFAIELMRKNLQDGRNILLLWNRRNFSLFLKCTKCGYIPQCLRCSSPLKLSIDRHKGVCSFCGAGYDVPEVCPECNTGYIRPIGVGIERLENIVKKIFPEWKASKVDKADDSTRIFLSTSKIANYIISSAGNFDIIFVLDADKHLSLIDYDSALNAFMYLRRVASMTKDSVYVFTHNPGHYIWESINKKWEYFYDKELALRKKFSFPPYGKLVKLTLRAKNKNNLFKKAQSLYNSFKEYTPYVFGPLEEIPFKMRDKYRYSVIVQFKKKRGVLGTLNSVISGYRSSSYKLAVEIK